ncbi:MAG: hypothetical protein ACKV19_16825 [Verrucomicrobiales bacterium]
MKNPRRFALGNPWLKLKLSIASRQFIMVLAAGPLTALAAPSIKIDSVTPDAPWMPGDMGQISVAVTYTDAPFPAQVDFIIREVGETATKEFDPNVSASVSFDARDASKLLKSSFYQVPYRSCLVNINSSTTPACPTAAALADTLTRLQRVEIVARLREGSGAQAVTVASAVHQINMSYPEIVEVGQRTQPLMSELRQRIKVQGAKFTQVPTNGGSITLRYHKVGDPATVLSLFGWRNPEFNRECVAPTGGGETLLGACGFEILDDTTVELTQRNCFPSGLTAGNVEPDALWDKYLGDYDLHVFWSESHPGGDTFVRQPDAVLPQAFTMTAFAKNDAVAIKKLTLAANTNPPTDKMEEFVPGGGTSHSFAPNAHVGATVELEYTLTRRLGARIWFVLRRPGQAETIVFPQAKDFWNTLGQPALSDGSSPRTSRFRLLFPIPTDGGLEFHMAMTDIASNRWDQNVFVATAPLVLGLGDKLEILPNSVFPALSERIRRDTAYDDFRADVSYSLSSQDIADLVLRLFDENGNFVASSNLLRVTKAEGSVASKRVPISQFTIRADAQGRYPNRLFLRAVFLDPVSGVEIKSTPATGFSYPVFPRAPVLVVPGIAGCYGTDLRNDAVWSRVRGRPPFSLTIDPFAHVYDDLVQSLKNAGYVEGENLFIANYDWRMTPGPSDGTNDGVIQMTAAELTDSTWSYGVDYFAYFLKEAAEAWRRKYPDAGDLPGVDVISHSTGGLVVRSYQQNAARGAVYLTDEEGEHRLPQVERSIMIAVPNSGASKIWNPWNDNWVSDTAYKLVLSKLVARAFKRVRSGLQIEGPLPADAITRDSVLDDFGNPSPVRFIRRYVPTIRSLLPTYPCLVNEIDGPLEPLAPEHANDLVIDLNTNMNLMFTASGAANTVIYSINNRTPVTVERRVGPAGWSDWDPISPMNDYTDRQAAAGEVWYEDIWEDNSGDGTVPRVSSFGTFANEPRVKTHQITQGDTTHTGLCSNRVVQELVFRLLGFDPAPTNLSTGLARTENILALSAGIDPVECLFIDASGRRLGYTAETGVLTEIPGSVWLGEADGIALVYGPLDLPLSVRFDGLGEDYLVQLRLRQADDSETVREWGGHLETGQSLTHTVAAPPPGPIRLSQVVRLENRALGIGIEGILADGTIPVLEQSPHLTGPWTRNDMAVLELNKGRHFVTETPRDAPQYFYRLRLEPLPRP